MTRVVGIDPGYVKTGLVCLQGDFYTPIGDWYPKPLMPLHWTMEDIARAAFEKGLNINLKFVRSS